MSEHGSEHGSERGPARRGRNIRVRTSRMEAFSDGVFSIAITLLVLDLAIPDVAAGKVGPALANEWPIFLAYVVSFASIGATWLNHTTITEYLDRADSILLRLNLLVLFFVSLLPFPTHLVANYIHSEAAERIGVTIYGINLLAISAFTSILWHYAVSEGLVGRDKEDEDVRALTAKLNPGLISYAVGIGIGLLAPRVAVTLYLVIALFVLIPFRAILRWIRRPRGR